MARWCWPRVSANGWVWFGATLVEVARADAAEYRLALDVPRMLPVTEAITLAPAIYQEIERLRSGAALLVIVEREARRILGEKMFAERWPEGLSMYRRLEPRALQLLAQRLIHVEAGFPKDRAALTVLGYALLGFAAEREIAHHARRSSCSWCYRTAVPPGRYCAIHQVPRSKRLEHTKKRGSTENLDVARRRARRIRRIALELWRDELGIYHRLYRQLRGIEGGLKAAPPPLPELRDDDFASGPRIGVNGAAWFIYLWNELPRMQQVLGPDWPELVRAALERENWLRVLQRLGTIDPHKEETDACQWAQTLIEAEAWEEAQAIEREQPRRGRPRRDLSDQEVRLAMQQLREGIPLAVVAQGLDVSKKTLYRWKALLFSTGEAVADQ